MFQLIRLHYGSFRLSGKVNQAQDFKSNGSERLIEGDHTPSSGPKSPPNPVLPTLPLSETEIRETLLRETGLVFLRSCFEEVPCRI